MFLLLWEGGVGDICTVIIFDSLASRIYLFKEYLHNRLRIGVFYVI